MKKIIIALLAAWALSACSNGENDTTPIGGQYVGHTENIDESGDYGSTFCLTIESGVCTDFIIYSGAKRFDYYRPADISTKGSYPKYTYRINDFTVRARFADLENFTADLSGVLRTHKDDAGTLVGEVYSSIALEATNVHFKLGNTPLDANDDGFLDSKQ